MDKHTNPFLKNYMDRDRFPILKPSLMGSINNPSFDSQHFKTYAFPINNLCFKCKINKVEEGNHYYCSHGKMCISCIATYKRCPICPDPSSERRDYFANNQTQENPDERLYRSNRPFIDQNNGPFYSSASEGGLFKYDQDFRYTNDFNPGTSEKTELPPAPIWKRREAVDEDSKASTNDSESTEVSVCTNFSTCENAESDMGITLEYNLNSLNYTYQILFTINEADHYYFLLMKEIDFIPEDQVILTLGDRKVKIPRRLAAYGDDGLVYKFNNYKAKAKKWTPSLLEIKRRVEDTLDYKFNFALVNYYRSGSDSISQHRDDEPDLVPRSPIVGISFGGCRKMRFTRGGFESKAVELEHGSMIVMKHPTNSIWKHGIAKCKNADPRISITFRNLVSKYKNF